MGDRLSKIPEKHPHQEMTDNGNLNMDNHRPDGIIIQKNTQGSTIISI